MSDVLLERPSDGVLLIRINRPEHLNALNRQTRTTIANALTDAGTDASVRCAVITGDERAFAAGGDINELKDAQPIEYSKRGIHKLWDEIGAFPKPLIAAVNGFALGAGCELALHADIIIAGETAKFGLPEVRNGIIPGGSGTQRLTRAVGKHKAMWMVLTAQPVSGIEAAAMGLASICVPDAEVVSRALDTAKKISSLAPLAVGFAKEAIIKGEDASLETALSLERKMLWLLLGTADKSEGMAAFLEKRRPTFKGD
jgi:enoyl-CoA hydratase